MDELDLSQFKDAFIAEAKEHLSSLNAATLELEKNPSSPEIINELFRAAHTLKGMSATMGYEKIATLTHYMEDLLDKLRKNVITASPDIVDIIFECFDYLEKLVVEIETGQDAGLKISYLSERIQNKINAEENPSELQMTSAQSDDKSAAFAASPKSGAPASRASSTIRINTTHLDAIMNLVGEMVIAKAQLEQIAADHKIETLSASLQQFDRIAIDLQEAVLKTRMVPVSHVFDRYPRMMRDLSKKLGKTAEFEIVGSEIEIDRILLDEINEPLVHILRNALDHGIEPADQRMSEGKNPAGKIILEARRERGHISIIISDDGKGLDAELLKNKAVERNIIAEDKARALSDDDAYLLICDPRFSTVEKITDVSGRGVGMDVVKTMIESFNGHLYIVSQKGEGTKFILNLPLSMAIISVLLVKVGNEKYAIPINNITEILACDTEKIKTIENSEVVMFRDEVLPLVRLRQKFALRAENFSNSQMSDGYLLRVESANKKAALVVDGFHGRKEIVLKTLGGILRHAKGFSGATITGDGSVILLIDILHWL